MKTLHVITVLIAAVVINGCAPSTPKQFREVTVSADSINFKPAQPERWSLPNGMTILFLADSELPLVQGALYTRGGSYWEPAHMLGGTGALGDQMRDGGAGSRTAAELDRELEELSAAVASAVGPEYGRIGFSALSADFEKVFGIFADVVRRPRFDSDRFELWRGKALESIRRRGDDSETIAGIAFAQLLYGNSVYGKVARTKDIKALTREDLFALHRQFISPREALFAVTGNVTRAEVARVVNKYFGDWTDQTKPGKRVAPPINYRAKPGVYYVEFPGEQATILMGQRGVARLTPDYPAIEGFNDLFGGGFGSRLFKRVRTELGFAYGVSGGISPGLVEGSNYLGLQTKVDSTGQAIEASIEVLRDMQKAPVTDEELRRVILGISNSFVFKFSSPAKVVERKALMDILSYPDNYDGQHLSKIAALSTADLQTVAQTRWNPDEFILVVVGDKRAYSNLQKIRENPDSFLHRFTLNQVIFQEAVNE